MNSIFRKTFLATILSATLTSVTMAAENYEQTMDGHTMDKAQLDTQQDRSSKVQDVIGQNERYSETDDALAPCKDDMKTMKKSVKDDQRNYGSENRPLSEHQGNVTDEDTNTGGELDNHDQENHGSENRPLSKHQDDVIEEEEEEEIVSLPQEEIVDEPEMNDSETSIPLIEESSDDIATHDDKSSHASDLYSMSADDLIGMDVVDRDGKK